MKWLKRHIGLLLMAVGVALLTVLHLLRLTFVNRLLLVPLALLLLGFWLHVYMQKHESRY